jgi:hypothetical protein
MKDLTAEVLKTSLEFENKRPKTIIREKRFGHFR